MIASFTSLTAGPVPMPRPLRVAILGSTGSIGSSALEVIAKAPDRFEIFALCAGNNAKKLVEQASIFKPRFVALSSGDCSLLKTLATLKGTEALVGSDAICEIAAHPEVDLVLAAIVGMAGLPAVLSAVKVGKRVALANKESLVCAGELVLRLQSESGSQIIPVDSEHSALFQLLQGHTLADVSSLTLTASGGPFLDLPADEFRNVTPASAIRHPSWNMGAKISVDSATIMNKALELIEAFWLFGFDHERIKVLVHPQSIVHAVVSFTDGSCVAQLSVPDMRGPISYALNYPGPRMACIMKTLDLAQVHNLEFRTLDHIKFPAVNIGRAALCAGGAAPAVMNIANEIAVEGFLQGRLQFNQIIPTIEQALNDFGTRAYASLEELLDLQTQIKEAVA